VQRAQCSSNLRNLHVAANLFVQQNGSWPQISYPSTADSSLQYAKEWIAALEPFGVTRKTWICPAIENLLNNPDYTVETDARIDYVATPFDDKPGSPHQWPRQPWFVEVGDVHGNGNLIVFADGSISDLKTVAATSGGK
jgi:hypothetical protein